MPTRQSFAGLLLLCFTIVASSRPLHSQGDRRTHRSMEIHMDCRPTSDLNWPLADFDFEPDGLIPLTLHHQSIPLTVLLTHGQVVVLPPGDCSLEWMQRPSLRCAWECRWARYYAEFISLH